MNVAVTACIDDIVTVQAPVPLHEPLQPAKRDDESGVAVSVTIVPESYKEAQMPKPKTVQLMPAGALVTNPPPLPVAAVISWNCRVNVAVTDCALDIVTLHATMPLHAPLKAELDEKSGAAVSVTRVPESNVAEHVPGQLMPAGALVTVPPPLPAVATVNVNWRMNVAVTECAADIVTMHAPVPLHAPLQPANRDVASGVAVSVTGAPES